MASRDPDSDSSEDPDDPHADELERLNFLIGPLAHTGLRSGSCIGDDMSSKGDNTTRLGAMQANGAGGSPSALVTGWCLTIQLLLINVFCICETRIAPDWKHTLFENLFLEKGYVVISHNRAPGVVVCDPHTNSSGVIIGIKLSSPGGLTFPDKDEYGRAVAACAPLEDGLTLRIVGTYGPFAAMTPRFPSSMKGIREERSTTAFANRQMDWAFRKGWLCALLGDMNSFPSLALDRDGGDFILRNESLAISLLTRGAVDTFRWRHPDLRAFTYVHPNGTASRLDQILLSNPASLESSILNAAIIHDPCLCRDHLIALSDLAVRTPSVPIPPSIPPNWKHLVSQMADDSFLSEAREQVLAAVTERTGDFSLLEAQLAALRAPILSSPVSPPSAASIHASLSSLLQECLPPPPAATRGVRDNGASHWWHRTKSEIQKLRTLRLHPPAAPFLPSPQRTIIQSIFKHWKTEHLSHAPDAPTHSRTPFSLPRRVSLRTAARTGHGIRTSTQRHSSLPCRASPAHSIPRTTPPLFRSRTQTGFEHAFSPLPEIHKLLR